MAKMTKKEIAERLDTQTAQIQGIFIALNAAGIDIPEIKYPRLTLDVFKNAAPKWTHAAVDGDGRAHLYKGKPYCSSICFTEGYKGTECYAKDYLLIEGRFDNTNWQSSLLERPATSKVNVAYGFLDPSKFDGVIISAGVEADAELTGSELCKAMLAAGQTDIPCFVGDGGTDDEVSAINMVRNVKYRANGRFYATNSMWYERAIPIKIETLAQKEAGL